MILPAKTEQHRDIEFRVDKDLLFLTEVYEHLAPRSQVDRFHEQVFLNGSVARHIQTNRLMTADRQRQLRNNGVENIPGLPADAALIKTAWLPLDKHTAQSLDYWDPRDPDSKNVAPRTVCVADIGADAQCQSGLKVYHPSDFFNLRVKPAADKSRRTNCEAAQASNCDVLLLLGLHLVTKELPSGFWSTFWWTPERVDEADRNDMPTSLKASKLYPYWRNYAVRADVVMNGPRASPSEAEGPRDNVFNFYIEGITTKERKSDCFSCHSRAGILPGGFVDSFNRVAPPYCSTAFQGMLRTDGVWIIALHPDASLGNVSPGDENSEPALKAAPNFAPESKGKPKNFCFFPDGEVESIAGFPST